MSKVGFIGCGNMGGALAKAAAKSDADLWLADGLAEKAEALAAELGGHAADNDAL
ncbi:MAG: NAD(P)-binding domain-containing protein, partial [Clostridia bacterium]|nr:NAD(P)-binding domain-containing protein [Clostridia bacterium]